MDLVPIVDVSRPSSTSLAALDAACRDHGFFLLEGHGLDDLIEHTWSETVRFFAADRSLKASVVRDAENPLGWFDRELTKRKRDHKEVFDFVDPARPVSDSRNRWPLGIDGFRETMTDLFDGLSDLTTRTLAIVHEALGLGSESRDIVTFDRRGSSVRLNHYPVGDPVPEAERDGLADLGATALGYHTDPGTLTLLLQDDTGGLQTESLHHGWIDVPPRPGTIVVNLGDCMQAWTNDRYRAAVHRVVPMTRRSRYSIPYFANPPREATVAPVAELSADGPRSRPFSWREFMAARAYDNFTDLGVDDTQVTDFRIVNA
ncbi:MAG: isopenicillin N synthase family dioxygenase [Ilumatobacteraceae bacterium]